MRSTLKKRLISLVPRGGLEPPCGYPRWILSPLRLPFRHLGFDQKGLENTRVPSEAGSFSAADFCVTFALLTGRMMNRQLGDCLFEALFILNRIARIYILGAVAG